MTKERYFELVNTIGFSADDINDVNATLKKVSFIRKKSFFRKKYEVARVMIIEATNNGEAFFKARQICRENGLDFQYCDIKVENCL